ncbi:MAG: 30S ribosomal protein S12 methylthiotransferase RimO [Eubacteriaceae bacterium]|nr:30S ribosomal protein S12 methylthiotransferase RimO [Eubacteriaceae bacterium]
MNIFIETLGCPKNFNDSQVAAGILEDAGHRITGDPEAADAIMINTCGFINDAKTESIDRIFEMADPKKLIIVSGCLTQRYGEELYKEMPEVDIFLGVNDYEKLPEILAGHRTGYREKYLSPYDHEMETPLRKLSEDPYTATIKIAEGCNNRCTYCAIPLIRGPYRSRPKEKIIREAERLAAAGTKELILIAQDTTAWGIDIYGEYRLSQLVRDLCRVDGIQWIRLMYCYEDRITDDLIKTIAEEPKVCHYLDIPLQHGSDNVLAAMDRRSTRSSIENTVKKLRAAIPDIHIRTTLITGFPGETEEDFDMLLDMVEKLRFQRLGVFAYSEEEGTAAAGMPGQIDENIREERKDAVMRRQLDISLQINKEKIGSRQTVLLEERDDTGAWLGRTQYDAPEIDCMAIVETAEDHKAGDMISVIIEDAFDYDLTGKEIKE